MLLLLSVMQKLFWGCQIPRPQAHSFCCKVFEGLYLKPVVVVQDPNTIQPTCFPLLGQNRGLFKENPRRIWCFCQANLDKVQERLLVSIWRGPRLGCLPRTSPVYNTRVWCWLCLWRRSTRPHFLWQLQASNNIMGYHSRLTASILEQLS